MALLNTAEQLFSQVLELLTDRGALFMAAEGLAVLLVVALALTRPRLGESFYARLEHLGTALARRPARSILVVGLLAILARAALLPWLGEPVPAVHDEQSILLQGQTFAAGRLANPTHPFWEHFETFYVNQVPAYASMYFPGRGAPLAAGLVLADSAWVGVWASVVLMCMAATWMLQAWVSPALALLGGALVTLRFGAFSFWVNSYYGGAFTALGAMLVIGALPRILREPRWRHGLLLGLGMAILMTTRPFEGALVCLPVAAVLLANLLKPGWRSRHAALLKVGVPATALVGAAGALLVAYNVATTANPLKTPYDLNRETYASVPAFLTSAPVQSQGRGPAYFQAYFTAEAEPYARRHTALGLLRSAAGKLLYSWNFYIGALFSIPFFLGLWRSRRDLFLIGSLGFFFAAYQVETWNFPQYTAPIFPVLLVVLMRGYAHLRSTSWRGRPSGRFLTRALPTAALALVVLPISSIATGEPAMPNNSPQAVCCKLGERDLRYLIAAHLNALPGRDLILVRNGPDNPVTYEMVYNEPDIDNAAVVWAHRLDPVSDLRLQTYFADRQVWEFAWVADAPMGYQLKRLSAPAPL